MLPPLALALLLALLQEAPRWRSGTWSIQQGEKELGHTTTRYLGDVQIGSLRTHHFRDEVRLLEATPGGPPALFTVERWHDAEARPLRFELHAEIGAAKSGVAGELAQGKAKLRVRQGPGQRELSVDVPQEAFLLANNCAGHLELLLDALGAPGQVKFFSANALQAFDYSFQSISESAGAHVFQDSLGERLYWSRAAGLTRIELPGGIVMRRVELLPDAVRIEFPAAADTGITSEEASFTHGDVTLAGNFTRPTGREGRLPGAVLFSGSGSQDRQGFTGGVDLGTHEILDHLTRAGFLVLRYDDRGVGASVGPTDSMTYDDIVADARCALDALRARPDVDGERLVLLGHSEGAMVAAALGASEGVAAVVLLAGPGRPVPVLFKEQLLAARAAQGAGAEALSRFATEIDAYLVALASGEELDSAGLAPELAAFLPARAWLASHLDRDPLPAVRALRVPVLVLQGEKDVQVLPERDVPLLREALAHHPDHVVRLLPGLDHLFKLASDPPSEADYVRDRRVDPAFLEELVGWLRPRLLERAR